MKRLFTWIFCCFFCFAASAQDTVATIHSESGRLVFHSLKDIDFEEFQSITIHSKEGNHLAASTFREDQHSKMKSFEVLVKSADGRILAEYSKKDFQQESVITGYTYYDDQIRFDLDYSRNKFPYTIETKSVMNRSTMFNHGWYFIQDDNVHTESSTYEIEYPADLPVARILNQAEMIKVDSLGDDEMRHFIYTADSIFEPHYQPYRKENGYPRVHIVPESYSYANLEGSMESWESYGRWYYQLWEGRTTLPKGAMEELDVVLINQSDDFEKAKAIYEYVQHKMRYVYVGYGNGGIQTMEAKDTYKLGYGDCKGLTNYTNAAMTYAGIESYPTLVEAGANHSYFDPNRPQDSFNHVFLCLPTIGDTTWLECTSKSNPFGYISDFTDDRYVLVVKPTGGELVRTPTYSEADNTTLRKATINMHDNGSAEIHFDASFHNLAMDRTVFYSKENSSAQALDVVKRELSLASFDLVNYDSQCYPNGVPILNVSLDVKARLFARKVGTKLMVKPFLGNNRIPSLDSTDVRTLPVYFKRGYTMIDSVKLVMPLGYTLKSIPEVSEMESDFGSMVISCSMSNDNDLWLYRKIILKKGAFSVEEYVPLCHFFQALSDSDGTYFMIEKE